MIGAPQRVSMPLASPFIETSSAPLASPIRKAAKQSSGRSVAKPGRSRARPNPSAARRVARAIPRRGASLPVSGIATTAPAAKPSSIRLRAPSERPSRACSRGSDAAQAPIPSPLPRKIAEVAARSTAPDTGIAGPSTDNQNRPSSGRGALSDRDETPGNDAGSPGAARPVVCARCATWRLRPR